MNCSNCGNEFEGNFCDKCGSMAQKEKTKANLLEEKVKESFIEPEESLVYILGTNTAKTFFSTGILGNGFAVLSDKRMYFKGRCYVRAGKGFFKKMEERVVDLNDITGTGFVHNKNIIINVIHWAIVIFLSMGNYLLWPFWIIYFATGKKWAKDIAYYGNWIFLLPIITHFLNQAFNYSLFEVSYAGGGIAFDLSWITKADSENFQKSLQKAKSEYKKKSQHEYKYEYMSASDLNKEKSIPELLKEYKELLDGGIITQDEFNAKKTELLNK